MIELKDVHKSFGKVEVLKGISASIGIASGSVKIIHSPDQMDVIKEGNVLVTEMTSPDYVPAMKRSAAIVTDTGGQTSHAAIVSRELGIPCVVGTGTATHTLKAEMVISVDGAKGLIYKGKVARADAPSGKSDGGGFTEEVPVTATKVYVNLGEPSMAEKTAQLPCDGVGLMRAEFIIAEIGEHPRSLVKNGKKDIYVSKLVEGLTTTCAAFSPRPVVYRATDFKTNEYRNLKGGEEFEPQENNPMIGYRGALRYNREPEMFNLELEAIKKVRETHKNLWLMIPFVRTIDEFKKVKELVEASGLERCNDFKFWMRDEAVQHSIAHVIKTCRKHHVSVSICGQAATTYPEICELMVREGATSVSVSPDSVVKTRKIIASVEKKILLSHLIDEN